MRHLSSHQPFLPIRPKMLYLGLFLCQCLLFFDCRSLQAQAELSGSWEGTLDLGFQKLPLLFHFDKDSGEWRGKMDSPSQSALGIKASKVLFDGMMLLLEIDALSVSFEGLLQNNVIQGQFTQRGFKLPLNLSKTNGLSAQPLSLNRPQEPKPPFPYETMEVTFLSGPEKTALKGTITKPSGNGPFPAVVLVNGSGPQDRNGELLGHKPFWVIADFLTRKGMVVFRYDERGVGQSEGNFKGTTSRGFADDARAALERLPYYEFVDHARIGLIGHSEGGLIAWMLAAEQRPLPAYILALAPPVVPIADLMERQTEDAIRATGAPEELIQSQKAFNGALYQAIVTADDTTSAAISMEKVLRQQGEQSGLSGTSLQEQVKDQLANYRQLLDPWFFHFIRTDPQVLIKQIQVPIWAGFGGKDVQVNAAENHAALETALVNQSRHTVITYPDLNHLFQTAQTGAVSEYAEISETFNEAVLNDMADWILERK
ncbi:alpha/beta hydrolase [Lunatimonas salinarum]|uniref:alpha/beta hydrolase n=1 Tax=Lunatimonas salinarum TaxID=1774590 RepID=UPI001AE049AB|nr:alpha/beta hydrolase [Lunatimonas salinarum]